ncbi:RusA family crossover junction endodeoxyribonuclease, partial [Enterococcus faecium]
PSARRNAADETNDVAEKRISTYYDNKYLDYLKKIKSFIEDQDLLDDELYSIVNDPMGAIMEVDFYYHIPKSYKKVYN